MLIDAVLSAFVDPSPRVRVSGVPGRHEPGVPPVDAIRRRQTERVGGEGGPPVEEPPPPRSVFDVEDIVEISSKQRSYESLSESEQRIVDDLKRRDREVREHEAAHLAAAGGHARGGASFEYTTGPDGGRYATAGEVQIDTSPVPDDPAATITKMEQVKRAALAPAQPSSQDRAVAAQAQREIQQAQAELAQQPAGSEATAAGQPGSTQSVPEETRGDSGLASGHEKAAATAYTAAAAQSPHAFRSDPRLDVYA